MFDLVIIFIGIRIADVNHFSTLSPYSCDGSEERFSDCWSNTRIGQLCQSVRFNCSGTKEKTVVEYSVSIATT